MAHSSVNDDFKPVILITGASSGIGLALARLLWTQTQYRVVITVRKNSKVRLSSEEFKDNDRFLIRELDVTSDEERRKLISEVTQKWNAINVLVNNAGISYRTVIEQMDDLSEQKQMSTNYFGPMALIRLVLPSMRKTGRGKIINLSSVAGMLAMPTMGSYTASKYALEGATESLWYEMKPLGIKVSLIQPGFINSNSFRNVYRTKAAEMCDIKDGAYCDYYATMSPFIERMMGLSRATPHKVAKLILRVIKTENPPLRIPATIDAVIFHFLRRFLPRTFFHNFLFYMLPGSRTWAKKYSKAHEWNH
jgi:short-subunit dehydrogenase